MERSGQRQAMAAAAAVAAVAVLPVFLTGALAVQLRVDLDFDESDLGLTVAAFFGTAAVLSTVGGRVAERLGPAAATRCSAPLAARQGLRPASRCWAPVPRSAQRRPAPLVRSS